MKIMTILGTRPEIIRLSLIIKKIDELADQHILVHTGQNFTYSLNDVFFKELEIRKPDYILNHESQSFGAILSIMFKELEIILLKEKPDRILILGDTNSALCAILAERMNIPVYHMEAGNRCFDKNVPEEKNRRIIDSISSYNLPYTLRSRENLLKEGIHPQTIFTCGNPIFEILEHYKSKIEASDILSTLKLEKNNYFLLTIHRAENVDEVESLKEIFTGVNQIAALYNKRIICSLHPRTSSKLKKLSDIKMNSLIEFHEPFSFFNFTKLEKNALCVLTDSGTVQEECNLFKVPAVTIRNSTERPETLECGSNMITGICASSIARAASIMISQHRNWDIPEGYNDPHVSEKVIKYLFGGF